ncbi:M3 family metallopeptidase [Pelagicoccus mobilis]|uniref:Peptidase M3A/M3B catalytic domain-containing protein n=1 Tax=Pelagicoccus mobilis TaxID=415221 RepID=A0A934VS99_9BACT|nr:M3 family metallopeptidase [Pelagicoccus mobilis]MBK1880222.1 hypothetical protein [Pelagicoccus mobilis]
MANSASGTQGNVRTLIHEAGHAFHSFEAFEHIDLMFLRFPTQEFTEVASTSMEFIAADFYDEFYSPEDVIRAKRFIFEFAIRILTWVATIDGFQHWIYTNPDHSPEERTDQWIKIHQRFSSDTVDWSGLESERKTLWHYQMHLFGLPFYYIEYGISMIGALQVWQNYKQEPEATIANYRKALALGGTRPLPELFAAAGIKFDFSTDTIAPLIARVQIELESLKDSA